MGSRTKLSRFLRVFLPTFPSEQALVLVYHFIYESQWIMINEDNVRC